MNDWQSVENDDAMPPDGSDVIYVFMGIEYKGKYEQGCFYSEHGFLDYVDVEKWRVLSEGNE